MPGRVHANNRSLTGLTGQEADAAAYLRPSESMISLSGAAGGGREAWDMSQALGMGSATPDSGCQALKCQNAEKVQSGGAIAVWIAAFNASEGGLFP